MYQFKNNRYKPLKKEAYDIKLTCPRSHFSVKGTTSIMFCDSNASGFIFNNKTIKNNFQSVYPSATKYFLKKEKKHPSPSPPKVGLGSPSGPDLGGAAKSSFTLANVLSTSDAFSPPPKKKKGDKIISTAALGYTLKYLKLFYFRSIPNFQLFASHWNLEKSMPIHFFRTQKSFKSSLLAPLSFSTFTIGKSRSLAFEKKRRALAKAKAPDLKTSSLARSSNFLRALALAKAPDLALANSLKQKLFSTFTRSKSRSLKTWLVKPSFKEKTERGFKEKEGSSKKNILLYKKKHLAPPRVELRILLTNNLKNLGQNYSISSSPKVETKLLTQPIKNIKILNYILIKLINNYALAHPGWAKTRLAAPPLAEPQNESLSTNSFFYVY
jgi:hypothetical protein